MSIKLANFFTRISEKFGSSVIKANSSIFYQGSYVDNQSKVDFGSVLFKNSKLIDSQVGRFSYLQEGTSAFRTVIGNFCSIGANVQIGYPDHPMNLVSTSPIFYDSSHPLPIAFASISPTLLPEERTIIESDVWIGSGTFIKAGVKIGTGCVIGAGSIVTKDVKPYSINAGNPCKFIRDRFDLDLVERLLNSNWWNMETSEIELLAPFFNDPERFLEQLSKNA